MFLSCRFSCCRAEHERQEVSADRGAGAVSEAPEHGAPVVQHQPDQEQQASAAASLGRLAAGADLCEQDVPLHPSARAAVREAAAGSRLSGV